MRYLLMTWTVLALAAPRLWAQDPVVVDPAHFKVEQETDQVRVLRVKVGPGEKVPMQTSRPAVLVFLTDSHVRLTTQDGETEEIEHKAGDVVSRPDPLTFSYENLSDQPLETIRVELKTNSKTEVSREQAAAR